MNLNQGPTGVGSAANALSSAVKRPKQAIVQSADNGYVVSLDKTDEYGQTHKIANNPEEVADIIKTYFAA